MNETLSLDPACCAMLVIDLQVGVSRLETAPFTPQDVIRQSVRLLEVARKMGMARVLVHVGSDADGSDRLYPEADEPISRRPLPPDFSDFIPEVGPEQGDLVILKRQWGAFYGTDLDLQLRRRGIHTLVICGIATEFGVESTARDAYERGYHLLFVSDAMTGRSQESHDRALRLIFPRIGRVRDTQTVMAALAPER